MEHAVYGNGVHNTINGVAAADASDAWAVGSCASPCSGTILATTDGGSEWTTQYSDHRATVFWASPLLTPSTAGRWATTGLPPG